MIILIDLIHTVYQQR